MPLKKCPKCGGQMSMSIDMVAAMMGGRPKSPYILAEVDDTVGELKCQTCGYAEKLNSKEMVDEVLASGKRRKRWWQFWKKS